jgi:hypothetical protein
MFNITLLEWLIWSHFNYTNKQREKLMHFDALMEVQCYIFVLKYPQCMEIIYKPREDKKRSKTICLVWQLHANDVMTTTFVMIV